MGWGTPFLRGDGKSIPWPLYPAQGQEAPLSWGQLFTVGQRQLLRGHPGLHLFPSTVDKGSLPPQTGTSMFPARCSKQYFPLASSWQRVVCYVAKRLPGVGSCLGAESPFPWHSVVPPHTPQSPGRRCHSEGCQCPAQAPNRLSTARGAGAAEGCSLHFWAVLLPGGVMKTHNGVSFSWTPSAFSILHIIQEILVYTLEELL